MGKTNCINSYVFGYNEGHLSSLAHSPSVVEDLTLPSDGLPWCPRMAKPA